MRKRQSILVAMMAVILLLTVFCSAAMAEKSISMQVTITAVCDDYNHVGHEWLYAFAINDYPIVSDELISPINKKDKGGRVQISSVETFTADEKIKITACITENDSYPESGTAETEYTPTTAEWEKGFSIMQSISVIENKGRYKDCHADWLVTFQFTPMNN